MLHKYKLTAHQILDFAYDGAFEKWSKAADRLKDLPDNPIAIKREREARQILDAIGEMLKEIE